MEPPRVPFSAEGGSLRPGDSRGVQAHGTRAPKSWGFLHLFQPPHFLGGSGKFPESSEEQCLLLGPGPVISCRAAERLLGFGGLVPSGLQARALGNPPPLAPQSCCPGLLFGLQVGLLARPLGPPWRAPPVPAARARVNRALSVWAGAGRELGTASPRNAHCGSGCLFQLNDRSEAPGPINSVFWAGGGLGDRGTQTDNQVSQGDKLSPPRRVKPSLRSCEDSPGAAVEGWGRSAPTLVPERPYAATSAPPVARSNRQWVWLSPAESRMRGARSSKGSLLCSASRLRLPGPVICNLKSRGQGQ